MYDSPWLGGPGGGSGNDNGGWIPVDPIIIHPNLPLPGFKLVGHFRNELNTQQLNWWNSNAETPERAGLYDYIYNGGDYSFAQWSIDFFIDNEDVSWELFENWFMGNVDFVEPNLNINPNNIIYETSLIQQPLPNLQNFINNFPKLGNNGNYTQMPPNQVYALVGGSLLNSYNNNPSGYKNACAVRGSRALLISGINIPVLNYNNSQRTQKGNQNLNYILDAVSFNKFMIDKFGDTSFKLEGSAANDLDQVASLLKGKNGIYVIINNSHSEAGYSGHVDAIINGKCIGNAYTKPKGGVKSIRIWILN